MASASGGLLIGEDECARRRAFRRFLVCDVERRAHGFEELDARKRQLPRDDAGGGIGRGAYRTKRKKKTTARTMRYQPNALNARFLRKARNDLIAMIAVMKLTTNPMASAAKFVERLS